MGNKMWKVKVTEESDFRTESRLCMNHASHTRRLSQLCLALYLVARLPGADSRGSPPGPGPPIFTCTNFLEYHICPYDNTYSSFIDL